MTSFDYAFLILLALSALVGIWRGLIHEVIAVVGYVLAFFVARTFSPALAAYLKQLSNSPMLQWGVSFAILFIGTLLVLGVIRYALRGVIRAAGLGGLDRILGAGFGLIRGVLIAVVIVILAGMTVIPREDWWRDSVFAPPLETAVIALKPMLPEGLAKRLHF